MIGLVVAVIALVLLVIASWIVLTRQRPEADPKHDQLGRNTTEDVQEGSVVDDET
jgi:hypothetical protein